MKFYSLLILCCLLLGCGKPSPKPAVPEPQKFVVSSARVFTDGMSFDLTLDGRFTDQKVKAHLQGEINQQPVDKDLVFEGSKAERIREMASRTAFLPTEETTSKVDAGGTTRVSLYGEDGQEVSGEPRNPGEWRNLMVDAIKAAGKTY